MSSYVRPTAQVRYAHIYHDYGDGCLYVRGLSSGHALVAQLVRRCSDGVVCVRKSLRRPRGARSLEEAEYEFAREIRVVMRLQAVALVAGKRLGVPRLLSSTLTDDNGCKASYWELCNGGTLFSFLMRCKAERVPLPAGLAVDFLRQVLEALEFLHTALATPVFHGDLHSFNLALHFEPGRRAPELKLLDFGRARSLAATIHLAADADDADGDGGKALANNPDVVHDPTRWDIGAVQTWLRRDLLPRVLPGSRDGVADGPRQPRITDLLAAAAAAAAAAAVPSADDDDDLSPAAPLRHADRLLTRLDDQLSRAFSEAYDRAAETPATAPAPPMPPLPSLQPVIKYLRRSVRQQDLGHGKADRSSFWDAVVEPTRARGALYAGMDPLLCMTPGGLLEILHDAGMRGPWDVAMVDAGDRGMPVVGVLHGREREERGRRRVGEDAEEDDEEEEEDEEDREYGELW